MEITFRAPRSMLSGALRQRPWRGNLTHWLIFPTLGHHLSVRGTTLSRPLEKQTDGRPAGRRPLRAAPHRALPRGQPAGVTLKPTAPTSSRICRGASCPSTVTRHRSRRSPRRPHRGLITSVVAEPPRLAPAPALAPATALYRDDDEGPQRRRPRPSRTCATSSPRRSGASCGLFETSKIWSAKSSRSATTSWRAYRRARTSRRSVACTAGGGHAGVHVPLPPRLPRREAQGPGRR